MNPALLNFVIANEEPPALNHLRELLPYIPGVTLLGRGGKDALELAQELKPHVLLLLNIRMPNMNDIEAAGHAKKLPQPPGIIFTTTFYGYAIQAFKMNAVN